MRKRLRCICATMRLLLRCFRLGRRRRTRFLRHAGTYWSYGKLCASSLIYNSFTNSDVVLDSLFEPIYWLVDHVTRWFGVWWVWEVLSEWPGRVTAGEFVDSTHGGHYRREVFVVLVIILTTTIVLIVYICVLPVILSTYPAGWVAWHLCYGHWNLMQIVFHYYKAVRTLPGHPAEGKNDIPMVSICRKCINPKPPRTHHCSICNRCILKMDHHCPWLNNCVGHFNHRYFFSFCLFMTLGCVYCSVSSRELFVDAYLTINMATPAPTISFRERAFHKCIIYLWVLCSSVALALSGLTLWHTVLILCGETSIERHINKKERQRQQQKGRVFRNPYHAGKLNNLKMFLGIEKRSHWITRLLLPSSHLPYGDGMTWTLPAAFSVDKTILAI